MTWTQPLIPTGTLRVCINLGNALLAQLEPNSQKPRGISVELAQALADIVALQRRNVELEQALEKKNDNSDGTINGYAVRSSKFTSREKELEAALLELKSEVAERDKCILCVMEQMNTAAAQHESAVLLSTSLLHQQKTLNADIERDRQRLLQVLALLLN